VTLSADGAEAELLKVWSMEELTRNANPQIPSRPSGIWIDASSAGDLDVSLAGESFRKEYLGLD
jgi:hypothetical protein